MSLYRFFCYNMALSLTLAVGLCLPAFSSAAESDPRHHILLPPLSLQDALVSVSRQTGVTIYADDNLLRDIDIPAIEGSFTLDELLTLFLQKNHLIFRQQGEDLIVILPQPTAITEPEEKAHTQVISRPPIEDIVVTGSRVWNRDTGFARKRQWVGANAFLSKDVITQTPGLSVPDIIGTLPGVTAFSDMRLGQAATSEAEYLSVRNMGSAYTNTFVDGMPIESADMTTRSLSLKMLAPVNTGSVRVMKTPGAEWLGTGIGGSLNIETPDAFNLGADYLRVTTGVNYSGLRDDRGLGNDGKLLSAEWANLYNDNHLGVYLSGYFQQRYAAAESIEIGAYSSEVESRNDTVTQPLHINDVRFDFYQSAISRNGGSLAMDWHQLDSRYFLRTTYNQYDADGDDVQIKLARGESRQYNDAGAFNAEGVTTNGYYQSRNTRETLATFQLGGSHELTKTLSVSYSASSSYSRIQRPDYIESSLNSPIHSGDFSFDASHPQQPALMFDAEETEEYLMSQQSLQVRKFQGRDEDNRNVMISGKFELHWQPGYTFDEVTAGLSYQHANRYHHSRPLTGDSGGNFYIPTADGQIPESTNPQGPAAASLDSHNIQFMNGIIADFPVFDRHYFEAAFLPFAYQDLYTSAGVANPGAYTIDDRNRNTVKGNEQFMGLYLTATKSIGHFTFQPGFYIDNYHFSADRWNLQTQPHNFTRTSSKKNTLLPAFKVRYQVESNLFFRGSLRKAIARPGFGELSGPTEFNYDRGTETLLEISHRNPELRPPEATNIDLTAEWYPTDDTLAEASIYAKRIRNMIFTEASTTLIQNKVVIISQPRNGSRADLVGVELHLRHRQRSSNQLLDGLGADLSVNLQNSENRNHSDRVPRDTEIPLAPGESVKVQLFHESADLRVTLQWLYTGRQRLNYTDSGMDKYLQPYKTLDFMLMYRLTALTFNLQINNLLNQPEFYKTLGKAKTYLGTQDDGGNGSYVETGRYASLHVSWNF